MKPCVVCKSRDAGVMWKRGARQRGVNRRVWTVFAYTAAWKTAQVSERIQGKEERTYLDQETTIHHEHPNLSCWGI